MLMRPYRLAGHAVAAVLLAGVAVVATGAGAGATSGAADRPGSYGGNAVAASMEFRVEKQPFPFPVTDPVHDWVPYASSSIDSSGGDEALAATIYPGQGVLGVPALLCEFNAQFCKQVVERLPDYPEYAQAQYPSQKDASATLSQKPFPGSGPFEVTPNQVQAHADPDRVEATTVTSNAGLTPVVTAKQVTSHSLETFEGSTLVLTAESVLKNVDIGGQLHIDQISSVATAKIDGSHVSTSSADTTVSGASLAGQAVTIDSTGVHVGGAGDNGLLKKTANSALAKLTSSGITVKSLGDTKSAKQHGVAAEAGGLLVLATQDVNGPSLGPLGQTANGSYTVISILGGAGVNAFASPGQSFNLTTPAPPPVTPTGQTAAATGQSGSTPALPSAPQTQSAPQAGQPAVVAGAPAKPAALPVDLTNKKLEMLALVLLGYPLLMLLGAPLRAPARLPRAR